MQGNRALPLRRKNISRRNALRTLRRRDTVGLMLVGQCEVGKSALVQRWMKDTFSDTYEPTIEDFHVKNYRYMGQSVNVGLIDMTGSWDFSAMMDLYLNRIDSIMFLYDVSNESSVKELSNLYQRLIKVRGENSNILVTVVGTKIDKQQDLCNDYKNSAVDEFVKSIDNCKHVLTSARLNVNVTDAFENSLNEIVANMIPNEDAIKRLGKLMKKNEKSTSCLKWCCL